MNPAESKLRERLSFGLLLRLARETGGSPQYVAHLATDMVASLFDDSTGGTGPTPDAYAGAAFVEWQIRAQVKRLAAADIDEVRAPRPSKPRTRKMTRADRLAEMRQRLGLPAARPIVD